MLLTILSAWLFVEKRRLVEVFPEKERKPWDLWELRILVLISLTLQISQIVLGSRRKYNPSTLLRLSLWSAYLTADWVATVALGVLSNNQRPSCTCDIDSISNTTNPINDELSAFWAPFLLLHLGGPDTITAYALADNELWIRHLLGLAVQMIVAIYITVTAWSRTWLSFLTIPMLFAGGIKYIERTLSLRSANREQFLDSLLNPPDPGPNYAKFMEEFCLKKAEGFSVLAIEVIDAADQPDAAGSGNNNGNTSKRILPDAYGFFNTFRRLFVDLILSFHDRDKSRYYFQNQNLISKTAFEVVEIELGFAYEVFYTKAPIMYTIWGCIFRFITSTCTIIVFVLFLIIEKHNHPWDDLIITYILLVGAIILEFYAVILLLSSDWTQLWLSEDGWYKSRSKISTELKDFIFQHFLKKSKDAKSAKTAKDTSSLCSARGNLVFEEYERSSSFNWTTEVEFDHSILIWHIATDICYHSNGGKKLAAKNLRCKGSKNLSDYMLYLLVMCPFLLPIGIGMIRKWVKRKIGSLFGSL
ncbi:uncharacterized protein LOC126695432 [Quercus robur]|uniref:uncharacterized protein LOC126695432 n=1 Tax=Quercus robur TaxID=38942 RepID=UPI002163463C|nr:uncharacterized protein LOC126695432 [Quercus robur]